MNSIEKLEEEVARAVEAARRACAEPRWRRWAECWIAALDRTAESANRAARDARIGSGRPNAEDFDESTEEQGALDSWSALDRDVAEMRRAEAAFSATEPLLADEEAARIKLAMEAAELAAHAAALAAGAMRSSPFVAERIGPLALRHARAAQRLAESLQEPPSYGSPAAS